eukprot:TRINITY_DN13234_c0_g1_i1.p1 TRINITY_DN13234_c0_g1~~TRINITY_DN13234_c0_g1_i1.p1  ORF type:complete len:597 (-),score=125.06 TRINITY_DN13234_c0_g1_i1:157-1947(-)
MGSSRQRLRRFLEMHVWQRLVLTGDASRVIRDFGCVVRGVFDLCRLSRKLGAKHAKSMSLETVVKANCPQEMHLSKAGADVRTSNWENWPLSEEQVLYASRDAALGLMAFMFKFDMSLIGMPDLPEAAIDALVDLASIDAKAASHTPRGESESNHASFFQHMRNKNVKPPNLGKKEHPKGAKDALLNVCIVVSGALDSFDRSDMEKYVQEHGGKVSKSVTAKVTHLVTDHGEAGPSKLAKCKELGIQAVSEDVILQMVTKTSDSVPVGASSPVSAKDSTKQQCRQGKQVADADGSPIAAQGKEAKATDATKATADAAEPVAKKPRTTKRALAKEAVADAELALNAAPAAKVALAAKVARAAKAVAKKVRATRGSKKALSAKLAHIVAESSAEVCSPPDLKNSTGGAVADISTPVRRRMRSKSAEGSGEVKSKDVTKLSTEKPQAPSGLKKRKAKEMMQPSKAALAEDGIVKAFVDAPGLGAKKGKQNSKADVVLGQTPPKKAPEEAQASEAELFPTPPKTAPTKIPKKAQASQAGAVELDGATLSKADSVSMRSELANLAGRPELQGKGLSAASLLAALEKTNGLVNSAKRLLLGM